MRRTSLLQISCVAAMTMGMGLFSGATCAQEKATPAAQPGAGYDVRREGTLVGTVVSFTKSSTTPPLGAHATIQTSAGVVDVHLGDARLLEAQHFAIQSGDTLRIVGENVACGSGTQFVARVVQNGMRAVEVRSVRGMPLSYQAPKNGASTKMQGAVL